MITKIKLLALFISLLSISYAQGQTNTKKMKKETTQNNPLLCDIETGMCETTAVESTATVKNVNKASGKKVKLVYFTDRKSVV